MNDYVININNTNLGEFHNTHNMMNLTLESYNISCA